MAKHSVNDEGDPRKYYAAIPNIVFSLGLNPYELALYLYFKKVAGENGKCWKSTTTIAKEMKIGTGTVSRTKAALAKPRAALGGKPLISVVVEMQNGGNANHAVLITDIWPENMAELSRLREGKQARSRQERVPQGKATRSTGEHRVPQGNGTRSSGANKEEPPKNNPEEDRRGWPFDHFAVVEYTQTIYPEPPLAISQAEVIAHNVPDSELGRVLWTKILRTFKGNGYQARHAGNAVDRFLSDLADIEAGKKEPPTASQRQRTLREKLGVKL